MTERASQSDEAYHQPSSQRWPGNYENVMAVASSLIAFGQPESSSHSEHAETTVNPEQSSGIPNGRRGNVTYCSVVLKVLQKKRAAYFGLFTLFCVAAGILALLVPERGESTQVNPILAYEERYKAFRTLLDNYSQSWTFALPQSPQTRALQWLVFRDQTLETSPLNESRLVQRYALMVLFYACAGSNWQGPFALAEPLDEQVETSECDFPAVECDESGNIVAFRAAHGSIVGRFPEELGLLTRLEVLDLNNNRLQGTLPVAAFQRMTNLEILRLQNNYFVSSIPSEMGRMTKLRELHVLGNSLTGPLPSSLRSLDISHLRIQGQGISGKALDFIDDWPNLEFINVQNTDVTGTIPASIVERTNLRGLLLGYFVTGQIPNRLTALTNLVYLWFYGFGIEGRFPTDIDKLSNLQYLVLGDVSVTGTVPTTIGRLSQLDTLVLTDTKMTGNIPTEIGNLSNLKALSLFFSDFTGSLPTEIAKLSKLETLSLEHTFLSGQLPTELCDRGILIRYPCTMECSCCISSCFDGN